MENLGKNSKRTNKRIRERKKEGVYRLQQQFRIQSIL